MYSKKIPVRSVSVDAFCLNKGHAAQTTSYPVPFIKKVVGGIKTAVDVERF